MSSWGWRPSPSLHFAIYTALWVEIDCISQARHPAISQYGRLVSQRQVRSHLEARNDLRQAQSRLLGRVTVGTGSPDHEVTSCDHHRESRVGCTVEEEQESDMPAQAVEVVDLERDKSCLHLFNLCGVY